MSADNGWTEDGYPKTIKWADHLYVLERSGKPLNQRHGCWETEGDCPECGHLVIRNGSYTQRYCGECGLRLVWY